MGATSHAEALRQAAETLVQLAKAKQTFDELAGAQSYGEHVITQVNVARATINDAFDATELVVKKLRDHEQTLLLSAARQHTLFTEGAEGGTGEGGQIEGTSGNTAENLGPQRIPPADDSDLGGVPKDPAGKGGRSRKPKNETPN